MPFTHIHCSSRFDRSPAALEADLDRWMEQCSLLTLTEVARESHERKIREKGWNYFNAKAGGQRDNCAIAWRRDTWRVKGTWIRKLMGRYMSTHHTLAGIYSCNVLLEKVEVNKTLLVSCTHMPTGSYRRTPGATMAEWRRRKDDYQHGITAWSGHVADLNRKTRPDAILIVADWNINLRDDWSREYLHQHFGDHYKLGWRHMPSQGSLHTHGSLIDGSLAANLEITEGAQLLPVVRSSDHRPYKESFEFNKGRVDVDPVTGSTQPGKAWWGFGDYDYDEMFENVRKTEDGIVVTFDFGDYDYNRWTDGT